MSSPMDDGTPTIATEVTGSVSILPPVPQNIPYSTATSSPPVTLQFAIHNTAFSPVHCGYVSFQFYTGDSPMALVSTYDDLQRIGASASPTGWTFGPVEIGTLTATAETPVIDGGRMAWFTFKNIRANATPGNAKIVVTVGTSPYERRPLYVHKGIPQLAITSFYADRLQIRPGQSARLAWSTVGAQTVTLNGVPVTGDFSDVTPVYNPAVGSLVPYTLAIYNGNYTPATLTAEQNISLIVPVVFKFFSDPPQGTRLFPEQPCKLTWSTYNTAYATIFRNPLPPIPAVPASGGSVMVTPRVTTTYHLSASSGGPSPYIRHQSLYFFVKPAQINSFQVAGTAGTKDSPLTQGLAGPAYATLKWSTSYALTVTLNGSPVSPAGSQHVYIDWRQGPAVNPTYTLAVTGGDSPAPPRSLTLYAAGVQIYKVEDTYNRFTRRLYLTAVAINATQCYMGSLAMFYGGRLNPLDPGIAWKLPLPASPILQVHCHGMNGTIAFGPPPESSDLLPIGSPP